MYQYDDPTVSTTLPTPAPAGTGGYFTDGDPVTNEAATLLRADFMNMVMMELLNILAAANITPSKTTYNQVYTAISAMIAKALISGQCRLTLPGSDLLLSPFRGNRLPIAGVLQTVPAAGISLSSSGLTASTLYYIYAEMVGGVMTLLASTTGHSTDAATGVEVMTGDATKTLVGMGYVNAAGAWSLVLSWFNRQDVWLNSSTTLSGTVTTSSPVQISLLDVPFLCWGGHAVELCPLLGHQTSTAGYGVSVMSYIDGTDVGQAQATSVSFVGQTATTQTTNYTYPTEGYHVAQVWANTNSGQSITVITGAQLVKAEG